MAGSDKKLHILALEPFYGGSHRAFLDQLAGCSCHDFTIIGLPDQFWRWRTRHSAIYFARALQKPEYADKKFDLIFCTSMLNLPEFIGLAPARLRLLPTIVYFHENQLIYPVHDPKKRDQHTVLVNFKAALAADVVWFNSEYNRSTFINNLPEFFAGMPDYQPIPQIDIISRKSEIFPIGIKPPPVLARSNRSKIPHIIWAARWEHDKNPTDFFRALRLLKQHGIEFRLSVVGEQTKQVPNCFKRAHQEFEQEIENWGYLPAREDYLQALAAADIIVSTAIHEFFGISVLEAAAAGVCPLVPERLAYPEVFGLNKYPERKFFFYDGSVENLSARLIELCTEFKEKKFFESCPCSPRFIARTFLWKTAVSRFDQEFINISKNYYSHDHT
ncbi:DUF3524 domain-containing protein [Lentisphaerota bacterium ZTH]|nr:DUF3524 domain-containing protein [Lentisphaerota bacterium]WET06617.1 DUF3524 domain-containing protein [Lentisphaerota bacterium ZTH]